MVGRLGSRNVWRRRWPILLLFCLPAVCAADSWIQELTVTQIITNTDSSGQYTQLFVSQAISNPAGCLNADTYVSRTLSSSTLAILLSAYSIGKSARILVSSSTCDPVLLRPLFTAVGIQN
jgi:hypothetical protein